MKSIILSLALITLASAAFAASATPSIVGTWQAVEQKCEDAGRLNGTAVSAVTAKTELQFSADGKIVVKMIVSGTWTAVTGRYVATDSQVTTYGFQAKPTDGDVSSDTLSSYVIEKGRLVVSTTVETDNDVCPMGDRTVLTLARKK